AVEDAAQEVSSALSLLRRRVAEAGSYRTAARGRVTRHGSYPHPYTPEEVAAAAQRERALIDRMQGCQLAAESFRRKRGGPTPRPRAAAAMAAIQQTALAAGSQTPAEHAEAEAALAAAEASLASAEAELAGLLPEAATLRRRFIRAAGGRDTADLG